MSSRSKYWDRDNNLFTALHDDANLTWKDIDREEWDVFCADFINHLDEYGENMDPDHGGGLHNLAFDDSEPFVDQLIKQLITEYNWCEFGFSIRVDEWQGYGDWKLDCYWTGDEYGGSRSTGYYLESYEEILQRDGVHPLLALIIFWVNEVSHDSQINPKSGWKRAGTAAHSFKALMAEMNVPRPEEDQYLRYMDRCKSMFDILSKKNKARLIVSLIKALPDKEDPNNEVLKQVAAGI